MVLFRSRGGLVVAALCVAAALAVGFLCWRGAGRDPIVLTIWHNPTGHVEDALTVAVDRFNRSTGRKHGVAILVTNIAKAEIIHENLTSIAEDAPGAPEPPDIVVAYPKSVLPLIEKGRVVPFDDYFSQEELARYVPSFIEAGRIHGGKLYSFPIGRGSEGLILNRTLWNRFAQDTGAQLSELGTLEGLLRTAERYYHWTDDRTPNVQRDGAMFFMVDNPFNLLQAAFAQMGEDPFVDDGLNVASPTYRRVFQLLFEPRVRGYAAIYKGYGTDLAKTGLLLCWTSATAGITFVPNRVIYRDNTSEPVSFDILPFPVLEGGRKAAILRSGGFTLLRSTPDREAAAVLFLKWLTSPDENLRYVYGTGYLPVTRQAAERAEAEWSEGACGIWKSYIETIGVMQHEYAFVPQSPLPNYGELEIRYERALWDVASESRQRYRDALDAGMSEEDAWNMASRGAYEQFLARTR